MCAQLKKYKLTRSFVLVFFYKLGLNADVLITKLILNEIVNNLKML